MIETTTSAPPDGPVDTTGLADNDPRPGFAHLPGCPAGKERVETYTAIRPAKPADAIPAQKLRVTRCVQCGAHDVREA